MARLTVGKGYIEAMMVMNKDEDDDRDVASSTKINKERTD